MKIHTRQKRRSGFSLTEMLIAVGILAVLVAVAVPSILYYRRELTLTELDDNARAVFVAAQNHLTALRSTSAGELEVSAAVGRGARDVPSGAVSAGTELMYVSTDVSGAEPGWLVLPGSIEGDIAEGCYLVEFEPVSGAVYGVFFMERSGGRVLDETTYQRLYQYTSADGQTCRVRDGRKAFTRAEGGFYVGYYGADGALDITRPDAQTLPDLQLKLTNAEELRLDIRTADWPSTIDQSKVFVSVSITDGANAKTLVKKGAIQSGSDARVVLDTLKTSGYNRNDTQNTAGWTAGGSFAQWVAGSAIPPGADITATVSIWYQPDAGEGVVALPKTASARTNSLFAARAGSRVNIAYGRHLQNLGSAELDSAVTAAVQVREIDFDRAAAPGEDAIYSWADTYGGQPFVPIENTHLDSYNGGGLAIRSLNAVKDTGRYEDAGLFATFTGSKLENVTLVDARATGTRAGALAGTVQNAAVDGCRVYLTDYTDAVRVQGAARAGGLVGAAESCAIQNGSFASTVVSGGSGGTVGGLVGFGTDVTVETCYAAGHLSGKTVGGLVGSGSGVSVQNCYAAGTIAKATAAAGGLSTGSATVRRAYAAVEYVDVSAAGTVCGAVPSGSCANVYYLVKGGVNDAVTVTGVTAVANAEQMKKGQALSGLGSAFAEGGQVSVKAQPYNLPNGSDPRDPRLYAPYPYPTLTLGEGAEQAALQHYGDWLSTSEALFLTYYEKYADGTYGFCYEYVGEGGAVTTADTLKNDAAVLEDGYGVLAPNEPSLTAAGEAVALSEVAGVTRTIDENEYRFYTLDGAWLQANHGYQQLSLGGQSVWLDPDFAKAATLTETTTATAASLAVRTARQLANLDALSGYAAKSFVQERDIDAASYAGTLYGKAAGDWKTIPVQFDAATPFAGVYTGGGCFIRGLTVTGDGDVGLFGVVDGGTVRDVRLENCAVSLSWSEAEPNAGSLVGRLKSGTVTNAGVYVVTDSGLTRDAPYGDYGLSHYGAATLGGLVGRMEGGEVSTSFAAVRVSGTTAGGLIGAMTGGAVSNSYVGGHMDSGSFTAWNTNIYGSAIAGGFVGSWTGGTVSDVCYTTASVGAPLEAGIGAFAGSYPAGTSLSESYARNQVYHGGNLVPEDSWPDRGIFADAKAWKLTGTAASAHPYDNTVPLADEFDFKPVPGLDHYGDWPELKMLHGKVAYYERFETGSGLATEFFYYDRQSDDTLAEWGSLDPSRTGSLYSDGYAFLSLKMLHNEWDWSPAVTLNVAIGEGAEMAPYTTTYLGSFREDLTPYVKDESNPYDRPTYYAYALPNAALDGAVAAEDYFLQLRVAGLEDEAELSSLWLNPHFGRAAYNGYGETNPKDGTPKVPVPSASTGTIYIRSVRQFNNMRKYKAAIRSWVQELDMDAAQYKGHMDTDSEGHVTLGGLRVTVKGSDGTWQPTWDTNAVNGTYRLAITPITMTSPSKGLTKDNWGGTYDGGGHTIANLSIGEVTGVGASNKDRYYAGLFCNLSSSSAVQNLTLANCDVTGRSGSDKDYVGALAGYTEGTIENCTVLNTSVTATPEGSGAKGYTGGFVGYVRKGAVQNCGVRVEGTNADSLYTACAVTGAGNVGGFTGYQKEGAIQYCYAAVKVSGGSVAGGFIGTLADSGAVSNCYAAGHTRSGKYLSSAPNVTGATSTGGFVGSWAGGSLGGLCYTTCSVTGGSGAADVFAVASGKTAPAGCYAGGDVISGGGTTNRLGVATWPLAAEPTATQADAHPYDKSLPARYTHKPVTYADGAPMPHYGDWYRKVTYSSGYEWTPRPQVFEEAKADYLANASMDWNGNELTITLVTKGSGTTLASLFASSHGGFAITTDLGNMLGFQSASETNGFTTLYTSSGEFFCEIEPVVEGEGDDLLRTYTFTVPTASLPPYHETINLGGYQAGYIISGVKNSDPSASDYHSTELLPASAEIEIDGDFSDWDGYVHELLTHTQGNAPITDGFATGAAFGRGNTIYFHVLNEYASNKIDPDYSGILSGIAEFSGFEFSVKGSNDEGDFEENWSDGRYEWWRLTGQTYTGPGIYKFETEIWDAGTFEGYSVKVEAYLIIREDGSQEMEMALYLDEFVGEEKASQILEVTMNYTTLGGSLTIFRDPPETETE